MSDPHYKLVWKKYCCTFFADEKSKTWGSVYSSTVPKWQHQVHLCAPFIMIPSSNPGRILPPVSRSLSPQMCLSLHLPYSIAFIWKHSFPASTHVVLKYENQGLFHGCPPTLTWYLQLWADVSTCLWKQCGVNFCNNINNIIIYYFHVLCFYCVPCTWLST